MFWNDMKVCSTKIFILIFLIAVPLESQIPADRDGLLNGEGLGQAAFAEVNGYPGPKHVLDLADTLNLTAEQHMQVQEFFDEVKAKSKDLGRRIVEREEELYNKFRSGISEEEAAMLSEQIGTLRGRLRSLHLIAHLKTKGVLTEQQIRLYRRLRGVDDAKEHHHH